MGRPFTDGDMLVPHTRSRRYGWTHYGLMIPDLPEPHRYFTVMSLVGATGALALDDDHALCASPRHNASVVTGTAATYPRHFGNYAVGRDGALRRRWERAPLRRRAFDHRTLPTLPRRRADRRIPPRPRPREHRQGVLVLPQPRLQAPESADALPRSARARRAASGRRGPLRLRARCQPEPVPAATLPASQKAPLDHFVYHIVRLHESNQVLLSQYSIAGRP